MKHTGFNQRPHPMSCARVSGECGLSPMCHMLPPYTAGVGTAMNAALALQCRRELEHNSTLQCEDAAFGAIGLRIRAVLLSASPSAAQHEMSSRCCS
jgi:hypothetical protein